MFLEISPNSQEKKPCLFFNKSQAYNVIEKETLAQVFSCEFSDFFRNTFFIAHFRWLLIKCLVIKPFASNFFTTQFVTQHIVTKVFVMFCVIWYYLYNSKNTHRRVLLLVKLQAFSLHFIKTNTPPWVFFTFFKLYKCYQIAQVLPNSLVLLDTLFCSRGKFKMKENIWHKFNFVFL